LSFRIEPWSLHINPDEKNSLATSLKMGLHKTKLVKNSFKGWASN
jgi:hypothetical protein